MAQVLNILLILVIVTSSWTYQIPENARSIFAFEFFKHLVPDYGKNNFVVSPAAAQKLLAVICYGAPSNVHAGLIEDLKFKFFDVDKPFNPLAAYDMYNAHFSNQEVVDYFENDFKEVTAGFNIENFIVASGAFKNGFKSFAEKYFNFNLINQDMSETTKTIELEKFKNANHIPDTENMQFYSFIDFKSNFKNKFELKNGKLHGVGRFLYGEVDRYHVIELPLNSAGDLTLEIFMPRFEVSHTYFVYNLGNKMKDLNQYDVDLKYQTVEVILPEFKFENATNIAEGLKNDDDGIKSMFENEWSTRNMLALGINTKIEYIWQRTYVHITPLAVGGETTNEEHTETFDVSEKSFIYFIKSKDVLYFIGTRFIPED